MKISKLTEPCLGTHDKVKHRKRKLFSTTSGEWLIGSGSKEIIITVNKGCLIISELVKEAHVHACWVASVESDSSTAWTVACQAPLSLGFSRQEHQSGLPHPPPGDLPDPGMEPESLRSPTLAGRFFTTSATWEICSLEEQDIQDHWAELEQYLSGDLLGSGEAWIVFLEPVMQYFIRYIFILLSWKLLPSRYFKLIVSYIDVWLLTAISSFGYSELN